MSGLSMRSLFLVVFLLCCGFLEAAEPAKWIVLFKDAQRIAPKESPSSFQKRRISQLQTKIQKLQGLGDLGRNNVYPLWISNSVIVEGVEPLNLSRNPDVLRVIADSIITLPAPKKGNSSFEKAETMTYGLKKVRAPEVWDTFKIDGKGILVGIMDTGWGKHPELEGRVVKSKDFISEYADNQPNDGHGHGTHCLGTIGGLNLSGKSIGVAPKAQFIVSKIFSDSGSTTMSAILKSMQWLADPDQNPDTSDQPRVVSNSWGGGPQSIDTEQPRWEAVQTWRDLGIVPVFAAGNSGNAFGTMSVPGGYPHAFAVGATDFQDKLADFSSCGPISWAGKSYIKPDISAPGVDVYSLKPGGGYTDMSGTSMATPHIAGVVALLLQADPALSVDRIEEILMETSLDLGDAGKDNSYGQGRVDAYKAVELALKGARLSLNLKAADGAPLAGRLFVTPGGRSFRIGSDGKLSLSLPEGAYDLNARSFGFGDATKQVMLKAKETLETEIKLQASALFNTSIKVQNEVGEALQAKVRILDTPLLETQVPADGYTLQLPGGKYTASVQARGYYAQEFEFSVQQNGKELFKLKALPPTVLIDLDPASSNETWFATALKALNFEFDSIKQIPALDLLLGYSRVIITTGNKSSQLLSTEQEDSLTDYVKAGGQLVISGQDVGYALRTRPFYKEVLGSEYVTDSTKDKSINGLGLKLNLNGSDSANNQNYADVIKEVAGTTRIFSYGDGTGAGISRDYGSGHVVYLSFGFEGVAEAEKRKNLMSKLIALSSPSTRGILARLVAAYPYETTYALVLKNIDYEALDSSQALVFIETSTDRRPLKPVMDALLRD